MFRPLSCSRRRASAPCPQRLALELLEERCVLSAAPIDLSGLSINLDSYDESSILVRFASDAISSDGLGLATLGSSILSGTEIMPAFSHIADLYEVLLPEQVSVETALSAYSASDLVVYAEPNFQVQVDATPDDLRFGEQWGFNNSGQTGGTVDADIDALEAWNIHTGSGNTIVAVIDTGVDYTHPDLADNIWTNTLEFAGLPGVDDDGNGFVDDIHGYDFANNDGDPLDDHNHGTHVAGTIGAVGDNGIGVTGVNWDVQIMALKFLDAGGSGSLGNAIQAINYAVANGATISNNSWGFNGGFSQALHDAIEDAGNAGHIFVAAAGNGNAAGVGQNNDLAPFYPASFDLDNIIAVAATDHDDQLAVFSNYGATTVDLGAPGVGILSTTRNDTYSVFNGTSMATPHVTGTVALLADLQPTWTSQQIISHLLATVDPIDVLQGNSVTGGRLNVEAALLPDTSGPRVVGINPTAVYESFNSVRIAFNEPIDVSTFSLADIERFDGPSGPVLPTELNLVDGTGGRRFDLVFQTQIELGSYAIEIGPNLTDLPGNLMNQDADGSNGEDPQDRFKIVLELRPPATGEIAHWALDTGTGTEAADSSGNGLDGTLGSNLSTTGWVNTTAPISEANPYALRFDGQDDYVSLPSGGPLNIASNAVSVSLWVNLDKLPSELGGPSYAGIFDSSNDAYIIYEDDTTDELRFKITDFDGTAERPGISAADLETGRWYHVVGVYDGEMGTASIYLDGQLVDSHTNSQLTGAVRTGQVAALGRDGANARYFFDGQIDDVKVFDRALSVTEVALLANRSAGILVTPSSGLETTESGDTASFTVLLEAAPTDDVTINLSSSDVTEGTIDKDSLTFTPANWFVPQTVTVTGVDDPDIDDDQVYSVVNSAALSADPNYDALEVADVSLTNLDNEIAPAVSTAHWSLDDGSGTVATDSSGNSLDASLGGNLDTTGWVTSAAPTAAANPYALRFDGVDDHVSLPTGGVLDIGTNAVTLSLWINLDKLPNAIGGSNFAGIYDSSQDSYVLYEDDLSNELRFKVTDADGTAERPGIAAADLETNRWYHVAGVYDGEAGQASIYLDGELKDVHSNIFLKGLVQPGQIAALGRDGTNSQHYFQGGIDEVQIFDRALTEEEILLLAERAVGVSVIAAAGLETSETGGTADFSIVLDAAPAANVTIQLATSDVSEGIVNQGTVTFTPTNWSIPQVVTVSGVDDLDLDGDVSYSIVTSAAFSSDSRYDGLEVADVQLTNIDDEIPPAVPIAHWTLDEGLGAVAGDSSGNGLNGTLNGGLDTTGWTTDTAPLTEGNPASLQFDGVNDYVSLPNGGALDIATNAVTLSLWVKLGELPNALSSNFFAGIYDSTQDSYVLYEDDFNDELRFKVTDADGTAERPGISAADLEIGQWHHIVGVYDGDAGKALIYLDGELKDVHTNASLTGLVKPGQIAALGRDGTNNRYYFNGQIDNVKVFDRALGPGELQFLNSIQREADFDGDGVVSGLDFLAWQRGFGLSGTAGRSDGDADNDADVDVSDLGYWEQQYGQGMVAIVQTTGGTELLESSFLGAVSTPSTNSRFVDAAITLALTDRCSERITDAMILDDQVLSEFFDRVTSSLERAEHRSERLSAVESIASRTSNGESHDELRHHFEAVDVVFSKVFG